MKQGSSCCQNPASGNQSSSGSFTDCKFVVVNEQASCLTLSLTAAPPYICCRCVCIIPPSPPTPKQQHQQYPANALVHRPVMLQHVVSEDIKVCEGGTGVRDSLCFCVLVETKCYCHSSWSPIQLGSVSKQAESGSNVPQHAQAAA